MSETVLIREAALQVAARSVGKVFESGRNNRGRRVEEIQTHDNIPGGGYPWCDSFVHANFDAVLHTTGGKGLGKLIGDNGSASVGVTLASARKRGVTVTRPLRADLGCAEFTGDNWPDHIFHVERVLRLGPILYLQTIEGNTGPSGSVSDPGTGRDGVYRKRRFIRRSKVWFIRPRGRIPVPAKRKRVKLAERAPHVKPGWVVV